MQPLLAADGSGRLFVNNPGGPWSWQACEPNLTRCKRFTRGRNISTNGAPPGTVFRVTGGGDIGTSPVWRGNLEVVKPPSIRGPLRANELLTPVAATWSGGWTGDFDQTQLAACRTARGHGCISITDPKYIRGCRNGKEVIDPAFAGFYLRVANIRLGPGTAFGLNGVTSPYGRPIWKRDGQTAVAIVGRIKRSGGPPRAACEPTPLNSASISEGGAARVKCVLGCQVDLVAVQGPVEAHVLRRIGNRGPAGTRRSTEIQLPDDQLAQFEPGHAQITVWIDGELVAQRYVLLGR